MTDQPPPTPDTTVDRELADAVNTESNPLSKRVLLGAAAGQFIEFYDFTLYGLTAVLLSKKFFPSDDPLVSLLSTFAVFGVAFIARPLGGLFFGQLGDRVGRRKVLFATLLLIGLATTTIGLLPGYATVGALAPALLVLCRLLQGFSAGGESVGAASFVFEHAPVSQRGMWINVILAATALPSVFGGALMLALNRGLGAEAFESWGWRIPFLIALPLSIIGLYIRAKTEESELFKRSLERAEQREFSPLSEAFAKDKLRMFQVVVVMGLVAMGFYSVSGYFVPYVQTVGHLSREASLVANGAAMLLYTIILPLFGRMGDRVGRRPMLIAGAVAIAVLSIPSFMMVTSGNFALALLGQALFVVAICIYGGGCYTFFVEAFTTRTRFTSAAVSYNVGYAVFGGSVPFISTALQRTGVPWSPGAYIAIMAVVTLVLIFATKVPETRGALH